MLRNIGRGITGNFSSSQIQSLFPYETIGIGFSVQYRFKRRVPLAVKKKREVVEDAPTQKARARAEKYTFKRETVPNENKPLFYQHFHGNLMLSQFHQNELEVLFKNEPFSTAINRFWFLHRLGKHPNAEITSLLLRACLEHGEPGEATKIMDIFKQSKMRVLPTQRKLFAANLLLEGKTAESEEQYQLIEKDFAKSREKVLQNLEKKRKSDKRYAHLFPLRVAKADEFYNPRIAGALAKTSRIFISELIFALESQQNEKLPNLVSELPAESPFHPFINNFKDKAKTVGTNFIFIKTLPLELLKRNFNFFFDLVNSNLNDKAKVYDLFAAHFASQGLTRDLLDVVEKMKGDGLEISVEIYDDLIQGYTNNNNVAEAFKIYETLLEGNSTVTLGAIFNLLELSANNNLHDKVHFLSNLLESNNAPLTNAKCLWALIDYHSRNNSVDETIRYYTAAKNIGAVNPRVVDQVVSCLAPQGKSILASTIVDFLESTHQKPLEQTFTSLITNLHKDGYESKSKSYQSARLRAYGSSK